MYKEILKYNITNLINAKVQKRRFFMRCKTIITSIVVFLNLASVTAFATSPTLNNMIFFGDSLTDIGNNTWVLMDGSNLGAPIINANYQNNKYLWINYLVEAKLGKPVYPSSTSHIHLDPLNDNISYAYASADTSNEYLNTDWPQQSSTDPFVNTQNCLQAGPGVIKNQAGEITSTCVPGVIRQVDNYLTAVQHKPNPNTAFFIWAGANDLFYYLIPYIKEHGTLPEIPYTAFRNLEIKVAGNINEAKKKLIDAGVKPEMIYILDLPDLSQLPAISTGDKSWSFWAKIHLFTIPTVISKMAHNVGYQLESQYVEEKYRIPSSHYIKVSDSFNDIIQNPKKYELTNIDESCVLKNATPACTGFVFYNNKHPSTHVHKILSDVVLHLLLSISIAAL